MNATGGSANATLPSHTHTATVSDPGHLHAMGRVCGGTGGLQFNGGPGMADISPNTSSAVTGITVSNSTEGASATNANLPPYYALCYIMKT